jgi:hypothetical protein
MTETAPGKSNSMDSPVPNTSASAGDREMPVKVYPDSSKLGRAQEKPGATMDSPAPKNGYTKK